MCKSVLETSGAGVRVIRLTSHALDDVGVKPSSQAWNRKRAATPAGGTRQVFELFRAKILRGKVSIGTSHRQGLEPS